VESEPTADEVASEFGELIETHSLASFSPGGLYVNVDVNDLLDDYDEAKTWEILGKLKDMFG